MINCVEKQSPIFKANFNSPRLQFSQKDFYVRIRGYGKNSNWAEHVKSISDDAVNLCRKDVSPENVLRFIVAGIRKANQNCLELSKKIFTGILRTERKDWSYADGADLMTPYSKNRYHIYEERFDKVAKKPLESMQNIAFSVPKILDKNKKFIQHSASFTINNALDEVFKLSNNIYPKYVHTAVKPENLPEVNSNIAEIRYILAHATPWLRGSDAISNAFMRVLYKSIGIKSYPLKKGISLDLEAFCTTKDDYKKKFLSFFEKEPKIID